MIDEVIAVVLAKARTSRAECERDLGIGGPLRDLP